MADKAQTVSNMNTRQLITAGVFGVIILVVLWQVWGMFGKGSTHHAATPSVASSTGFNNGAAPHNMMVPQQPKPTVTDQVPEQTPTTAEDAATMKMQQDAQQRYLVALNELQMLRVAQNIAEANRSIMAAKFDTVTSEKKIVDLLAGPAQPPPNYAEGLVNPAQVNTTTTHTVLTPEVSYTVVSVTETHDTWSAVIGSQGTLYHVRVGDVLPPDGSTVISIHTNGVVLEKDGTRRKISLVSII